MRVQVLAIYEIKQLLDGQAHVPGYTPPASCAPPHATGCGASTPCAAGPALAAQAWEPAAAMRGSQPPGAAAQSSHVDTATWMGCCFL